MNYYFDYNGLANILGGGIIIFILLFIAIVFFWGVAYWKMFKKTGRKGWESLIPIYSYWVLIEISGLNWWWFLLLAIDVVFKIEVEGLTFAISMCSFLASFNCYYNIARRFGRDKTTSIFAGIFPFIFVLIFAFSKNIVFDTSIPVGVNGIFDTPNDNVGNTDNQDSSNYSAIQNSNNSVSISTHSVDIDKADGNTDDNLDKNNNSNLQEYSYCGDCGLKLDKDVKFCPNCGRKKI